MRILFIFYVLLIFSNAEELDFLNNNQKKHYKPLVGNMLYQYVPLIKTIESVEKEQRIRKEKIAKNFTNKENLKNVEKVVVQITKSKNINFKETKEVKSMAMDLEDNQDAFFDKLGE